MRRQGLRPGSGSIIGNGWNELQAASKQLSAILIERLNEILIVFKRIPRRFSGIKSATDFQKDETGQDRLDAICMSLVAVGEAF